MRGKLSLLLARASHGVAAEMGQDNCVFTDFQPNRGFKMVVNTRSGTTDPYIP